MAIDRCTQGMIAPLVDAITEGRARGDFQSDDSVADAWAIFYLAAGPTADQAARGSAVPRADLERIVIPFITRAIGLQ